MRCVVQRVSRARVTVDGEVVGTIEAGLCCLVGVGRHDTDMDARYLASKVVGLRVFTDDHGKMNRNLVEAGGGLLAISQFTLFGDVKKGKRPSFGGAMEPTRANDLFELFCQLCRDSAVPVETGRFQTHMVVEIVNDGPVTILIDSKKLF